MPCYQPIPAYRVRGSSDISFKHTSDVDHVSLPCGQCIGCRLRRSKEWAIRCVHEGQMHDCNSFITLTYSPAHLPDDLCINVQHFQDFMKRLRSRLAPGRVRFFHCGEYGDDFSRPHYHAIIFGFDFPDRIFYREDNGVKLFSSEFLADVWGLGFCTVGDLSFESAAYVARYVTKKVNGEKALDYYWRLDERTGELREVTPEYATMSRGSGGSDPVFSGGIGAGWYAKYGNQVRKHDSVILRGYEMQPPRFYDKIFSVFDALECESVKELRCVRTRQRDFDNSPDRLRVREVCKQAQFSLLKRGYEDETSSI